MIEIYIAGQLVSAKDEYFELKKSINVLLEPDKRASEVTKTVEILGSKEADRVFMAQFDVNFNAGNIGFDPTRKAPLIVYENSTMIMTGYCQLTDVVVVNEVNHTYKCVFYGVLKDLFATIGDAELCDIDFSSLNHVYNKTNITNSWSGTLGSGYVYPMVNFGWLSSTFLRIQDFRAWVYFKTIWDKIFEDAGFEYESNFINSERFKRLIYYGDEPFEISQSVVAASNTQVQRITSNQSITADNSLIQFNDVILDPSSQWSGAPNYRITPAQIGLHELNIVIKGQVRNDGANLTAGGGDYQAVIFVRVNIKDSGGVVTQTYIFNVWSGLAPSMASGGAFSMIANAGYTHFFNAGDYAEVQMFYASIFQNTSTGQIRRRGTTVTADATVFIDTTSFFSARLVSNQIVEGNTYDVGLISIGCMKQKDWLMGVIKMFNLYIDTQLNGVLLIEPREDFYTTEVVDLTSKLAIDRDFTIKPLELAKYKRYKYYYEAGTDRFGQSHYDAWNEEPYGSVEIEIDNDFAKDTKEVNLPFSLPCMSIDTVANQSNSQRVVPILINPDNIDPYKGSGVGKVLIWGGVQGTINSWFFIGETTPRTGYPYAGQIDNTSTPTYDLSFDIPPEIYWKREGRNDVALIQNGGLYAQYHEPEIEELTNKNSKIVKCSFALNEFNYNQLSFRKTYFVKDAYYRLHEIIYTGAERLSDVVLLKLNKFDKRATTPIDQYKDSTSGNGSTDIVISRNNTIDRGSDGIGIFSDNNNVNGSVSNVFIAGGSNNQVSSDSVILLNVSNQEQALPNTLTMGFNSLTYTGTSEYIGNEGSPFYAIFNTSAAANYTLPSGSEHTGKVIIVKSLNGDTISVLQTSPAIVDDITDKGEFYHNGTQWVLI